MKKPTGQTDKAGLDSRKRTGTQLKTLSARQEAILSAIPDIIIEVDNDKVYTWSNQAGIDFFGEDVIGKEAAYFFEGKQNTYEIVQPVFAGDENVIYIESWQRRRDGQKRLLAWRCRTLKDEFGNVKGALSTAADITERKRAEEDLRQAEENFRRSLDDSTLGIRIVSAEGETLYANRAILDLYGYADIEELRSTPVKKRYTPASYVEFQSRKKKRMNEEDYPSEYEINIIRKTGEIRCLQVSRKTVLWDGRPQFQAIYQDITERKKAEAKLRKTLDGLRKALGGIIQVLSTASEKRDPYTAGHQRRVADLARAIAQELGLSPDRVEGIRVAGVIHDVGKLSIPAEILSKPASLSKIEYELIQSHAQVGHDILGEVEFAWPIATMILQHHERMNGSGYPQRLKGDDILLESRILAVSDVIEAMSSHRPYRPALGIETALREIENNRGILYDPVVVSACLALFREKGYALKE